MVFSGSTVIIITSFLPVFLLTGREKMLALAYTKTFIMIVDTLLQVVTVAPVRVLCVEGSGRKLQTCKPFPGRVFTEPIIKTCINGAKQPSVLTSLHYS